MLTEKLEISTFHDVSANEHMLNQHLDYQETIKLYSVHKLKIVV